MSVALNEPFVSGYLFQCHGTAWTELLGRDANFCTKPKLGSVGERCGGVLIDAGSIDMCLELTGGLFILGDDRLAMSAAVSVDMV